MPWLMSSTELQNAQSSHTSEIVRLLFSQSPSRDQKHASVWSPGKRNKQQKTRTSLDRNFHVTIVIHLPELSFHLFQTHKHARAPWQRQLRARAGANCDDTTLKITGFVILFSPLDTTRFKVKNYILFFLCNFPAANLVLLCA